MLNTSKILLGSTLALTLSASVMATPPYKPDLTTDGNRWEITYYDDNDPAHTEWATQGICFYNNGVEDAHQRYVWVSDTYPDWNGVAVQEGDQIFMSGDFWQDQGHDAMTWEVITASPKNVGGGHWQELVEDGSFGITIGFGNTILKRVGRCQIEDPKEALEVYKNIDYPYDEKGEKMLQPMGNLEPLNK